MLFFFSELVIFYYDISCNEYKSVVKFSYSLNTPNSIHLHHLASGFKISSVEYNFLSWFEHTADFWQHTKIPNKFANVTWLTLLCILIPQHDVYGAWHRAWRNSGWILLYSNFLEVRNYWFLNVQIPYWLIAISAEAFLWFSVFELLGNWFALSPTCSTHEYSLN